MVLIEFSLSDIVRTSRAWMGRDAAYIVIKVSSFEYVEGVLRTSLRKGMSLGVRPRDLHVTVSNPYEIEREAVVSISEDGSNITTLIEMISQYGTGRASCKIKYADMYECSIKAVLQTDICQTSSRLGLVYPLSEGPGEDFFEMPRSSTVSYSVDERGSCSIMFSELIFSADRRHVVKDLWCWSRNVTMLVYDRSGWNPDNMILNKFSEESWSETIKLLSRLCGVSVKVSYSIRDPYNGYKVNHIQLCLMVPRAHLELVKALGGPAMV